MPVPAHLSTQLSDKSRTMHLFTQHTLAFVSAKMSLSESLSLGTKHVRPRKQGGTAVLWLKRNHDALVRRNQRQQSFSTLHIHVQAQLVSRSNGATRIFSYDKPDRGRIPDGLSELLSFELRREQHSSCHVREHRQLSPRRNAA